MLDRGASWQLTRHEASASCGRLTSRSREWLGRLQLRSFLSFKPVSHRPAIDLLAKPQFLRAWGGVIETFRDGSSPERRSLDPLLEHTSHLSPACLEAGLQCLLAGVEVTIADRLWDCANRLERGSLDLIILPSNIPALVLQPLLRSLAARRRVIIKSASAEPFFAPAFIAALVAREPALATSITVRTWHGGDRSIEDPLLARADRVVAYGDQSTIDDLTRRAPGKVWAHGPKTSVALVAAGADLAEAAESISRDVALFDQRGCLSVAAVYVEGADDHADRFAELLAPALERRAVEWPPGEATASEATAVQHLRLTAEIAGLPVHGLQPLAAGTVIFERGLRFQPSPGLRAVRVHAWNRSEDLAAAFSGWRGRIQGVAIAGEVPASIPRSLDASRVAPAGVLQNAAADWDDAAAPARS